MRRSIRATVSAAISTALALALPISLASRAEGASTRSLFLGEAFGSYSFVGETAMTGKTAYTTIGCQAKPGTHFENTMGSNSEENMNSGSVNTTGDAIKNASVTKTLTTSVVNRANLLQGRITASRVKAVSATIRDAGGMRTSAAGSSLTNVVVFGETLEVAPGPNTRITLPRFGYAVLNEQFTGNVGSLEFLAVNGIHVYITEMNPLRIPVGSQFVMAHAYSALKPTIAAIVGGQAYGHKLFEGSRIQSGPSAIVYMPCAGTGGKVVENDLAAVTHPPAFQLGEVKDTATGTVTSKSATSQTTSSIESVSLLGGLVTADLVKAVARASKDGSGVAFSDAGSQFVNLVVAGRLMGQRIAPNTAIQLPGIGTLWLRRVIRTPYSIEIRMIDLPVNQDNPFELKPGSKLQLAVARALVLP